MANGLAKLARMVQRCLETDTGLLNRLMQAVYLAEAGMEQVRPRNSKKFINLSFLLP